MKHFYLTIMSSLALLLSAGPAVAELTATKSFVLNDVQNAFVSQTDQNIIVSVSSQGLVKLLKISDLSEVRSFSITTTKDDLPSHVQPIPGSSYILVEKDWGSIELWNIADGTFVRQLSTPETVDGWSNYSLRISSDGKHIFLIGEARKWIDVFDLNGGYSRINPPSEGLGNLVSRTGFYISNDMKTLWLEGGSVASYDLTTGHVITQFLAEPRPLFVSPKEDFLVMPIMWTEGVTPKSGLSFYFTNKGWNGREYSRVQLSPKTEWANLPVSVDFDANSDNLIASDGVGIALFYQSAQILGDYLIFDTSSFKPPYNYIHLDRIEFFDHGKQVFASVRKEDQNIVSVTLYLVK